MEPDLPEPKARAFAPEERQRRKWAVYLTFLYVIAAYSLLHKFFVPLLLKFTRLSDSPYAQIDAGALLPIFLIGFFRQRRLGAMGSLLAGIGIAYGIAEVYWIATNHYQGWLAISRFLSSVPLSIICVVLLTDSATEKEPRLAWTGALLAGGLFLAPWWTVSRGKTAATPVPSSTPVFQTTTDCGPQTLKTSDNAATLLNLTIGECGFSPSISQLSDSPVLVENRLSDPVNIHLVISKGDGAKRPGGNWLIPPKETLKIRLPAMTSGEVAMWYSDTHARLGIAALLPRDSKAAFELSRNPIAIRRLP